MAESFKGFEIWLTNIKMRVKMHLRVLKYVAVAHIFFLLILSYFFIAKFTTEDDLMAVNMYVRSAITASAFPDYKMSFVVRDKKYTETAKDFRDYSWLYAKAYFQRVVFMLLISLSIYLLYPFLIMMFNKKAKRQSEDKYIRGSRLISVKELNSSVKNDGLETGLDIGGVRIPKDLEQRHFFVIGMPGVGKTTCLSQALEQLKNRNNDNCRGIVYCFKPDDYFAKFYDSKKGDILFNPLDERGIGWNLFNEIETEMDIDTISDSLIPDAYQQDPFWHQAARGVFSGILHYCYANNLRTNADIWMNVTAEIREIADKLKQTKGGEAGYSYIQDAGKQAGSVISTMMQYVSAFRYMTNKSDDFSISNWLERGRGWLFITNYSSIKDTLRPILSLFVDLVGTKLLFMRDDKRRRIFLILDEFSSLQKIAKIVDILTRSRSTGGSVWLGTQDIGTIDRIYSPSIRQSMLNSCGNSIVFAVEDPDTAKYLSERIGDTEISHVEETQSMGTENNRDGISQSRREKIKRLVMPSELHQLRDLECYFKLRNYDWTKTSIKYKAYPNINDPFMIRKGLNLDSVIKEQKKIEMKAKENTNNFSAPQYPPPQQKPLQKENEEDREKGQEIGESKGDGIEW